MGAAEKERVGEEVGTFVGINVTVGESETVFVGAAEGARDEEDGVGTDVGTDVAVGEKEGAPVGASVDRGVSQWSPSNWTDEQSQRHASWTAIIVEPVTTPPFWQLWKPSAQVVATSQLSPSKLTSSQSHPQSSAARVPVTTPLFWQTLPSAAPEQTVAVWQLVPSKLASSQSHPQSSAARVPVTTPLFWQTLPSAPPEQTVAVWQLVPSKLTVHVQLQAPVVPLIVPLLVQKKLPSAPVVSVLLVVATHISAVSQSVPLKPAAHGALQPQSNVFSTFEVSIALTTLCTVVQVLASSEYWMLNSSLACVLAD